MVEAGEDVATTRMNAKLKTQNSKLTLVIGYGNDLRGDDGAGPRVAETVAALNWPGVQAIVARQLVPELAEPIARAGLVLFVDACPIDAAAGEARVQIQRVEMAAGNSALGHAGNPGALLALAQALYGACPPAWLVAVPAASFELSDALSAVAERGIAQAIEELRALIARAVTT